MKSVSLSLLAAGALAASPVAHAQAAAVTCDDLKAALEESYVGFNDITGEEVRDNIFRTSYRIANSTNCGLYLDWDYVLTCWWSSPSQADAQTAFDALGDTIARCYPTWDKEPAAGTSHLSKEAIAHRFFSLEWTDEDDLEMLVELNHFKEAAGDVFEVSIRIALMPI